MLCVFFNLNNSNDGVSELFKGPIMDVDNTYIHIDGIVDASFYFNHNDILCQILLVLNHKQYHILNNRFSQKYTLVKDL